MTQKEYRKTKKGFLVRLYDNMMQRIKGNQAKSYLYSGKNILSKDVFYKWAEESQDFHKLFSEWESSNYDMKFTPSVDRINSDRGYTIDNMEWVTHSENSRRSSNYRRNLLLNIETGIFYEGYEEAGNSVGSNRSQFRHWFLGKNKSKKMVENKFIKA
jgi:hypothetical protein